MTGVDKMNWLNHGFSKKAIQKTLYIYEIVGFLLVIMTCWLTELCDPPFSLSQVIIETGVIVLLGFSVVIITQKLIKRIKYLEGFLVICSSCKRIRIEEQWSSIESVISATSDIELSHGLCTECTKKLYPQYYDKIHPADHPGKNSKKSS